MFRKELKKLKAYSLDRPPHRIKLNQNESPYDLPLPLKKKILREIGKLAWNRYPTPYADSLRKVLGQKLAWDPEGIVVAGGSNVLVQLLVIATALHGKMLTVSPTFSLYEIEGKLFNNRIIKVPLDPGDFSLPLTRFLKTIKKERPNIVFLPNPNAPTGNLFPQASLLAILEKTKGLVAIDEAYYPFSGVTLKPYLKKYPNLVILRTLSKAFSLAGVRIGYLLAHPKVAEVVRRIMLPFTVGPLQEAIGITALANGHYVQGIVQQISTEREQLFDELRKIPGVTPYPSITNSILFGVSNADRTYRKLLRRGILIRPMAGHGLKNCLRVTIGSPSENRQFLNTLRTP